MAAVGYQTPLTDVVRGKNSLYMNWRERHKRSAPFFCHRFKGYMRTVGEDAIPLRSGDTIALDPLVTITSLEAQVFENETTG